MSNATPKQRTFLWRATGRSWYPNDLKEEITKDSASELVGNILEFFKGDADSGQKLHITATIEIHTGKSIELDELQNRPPRKAKAKAERPKRKTRPKAEPAVTTTGGPALDPSNTTVNELLAQLATFNQLQEQLTVTEEENANQKGTIESLIEKRTELLMKIDELEKRPSIGTYTPKEPGYIKPKDYDKIVHILKTVGQVFLRGPAGCGKTLLAKVIAEDLDRDCYVHSCSGGPSLENVIGSTELVTDGEGNQITRFEKALPLAHMETENSITVMDETPALEPESAMGLNGLLERRTREVSTKAGAVKRHADNWIICTGNTNGLSEDRKYIGAQLQDGSNVDRTPTVNMGYEQVVEIGILTAMEVPDETIATMIDRIDHMRRACNQLQIPFDPSTRRLVTCAELFLSGMELDDAFEVALTNDVEERQRREIINW
jgi:hypothetical protein